MPRLTVLSLVLFSFPLYAAPESKLWGYWQQSNENNAAEISHQTWQEILTEYVSKQGEDNLFAYQAVTQSDNAKLDSYLSQMTQLNPLQYSKDEQYAYWVNIYNAITVDLILEEYPVSSITKLGGLFSFGPWDEKVVTINGKTLTLNDIEHRILRPIWQDPRTHYAVNCASLGCPNLQTSAFTARNSEQLLEQAAMEFINSDKGVKQQEKKLIVSSIYDWFATDFAIDGGVRNHLKKYRPELKESQKSLDYEYDWSLNEKR
ncbi:DUF547 domain-containing protein [Vibrio sinensis]|uniref:DUF547 domain-containing protein n=1 Tax=Vibrio sinensis TaxID=2302434 RepID=A0A3A6R239_9VIBR|nr:DUF547 domain-containing protein [Vibrio sinensis]RJX70526.1 DUF547 domain-containing protein [Vibrio sinensis]